MKKTIIWTAASSLIVLSLVWASCTPVVTEEEEGKTVTGEVVEKETPLEEEEEEVEAGPEMVRDSLGRLVEKPKYGGELVTMRNAAINGFDDCYIAPWLAYTNHLTHDDLHRGDWSKGTTGTGESSWNLSMYDASIYAPAVAESIEIVSPNKLIIHIRKGIYWHNKPPVNGRELVAEDVAFSFMRTWEIEGSYVGSSNPGWFVSVETPDKYTVVINCDDSVVPTTSVIATVSSYLRIFPKVTTEQAPWGDFRDWKDSIGTGPYMLVDYVDGSSATFARNPNFWLNDPLHPENQLPYLDGIRDLVIIDESTRYAALRTAKVHVGSADWESGPDIITQNPDFKYAKIAPSAQYWVTGRVDKPELPFEDVRVRRALAMGVDRQAIVSDYYEGNADIFIYPIHPDFPYYVPLDEMPESVRETFEYNPDKARQLLTEAGYPNGFKTELVCNAPMVDRLTIFQAYWEQIGVDVELKVFETGVYTSIKYGQTFEEMIYRVRGLGTPERWLDHRPTKTNNSQVDDPYINERYDQLWDFDNMTNTELRHRLMKEMTVRSLEQAYYIQLPQPISYTIWWPWVKSYSGEGTVGYLRAGSYARYVWLDQELKKEMGY